MTLTLLALFQVVDAAAQLLRFLPTTVTFVVHDDTGTTVSSAAMDAGFSGKPSVGLTDINGVFTFTDVANGELFVRARKDRYYQTYGNVWNGPSSGGMVPPVNIYTVRLKRIVNPVPMERKRVRLTLPSLEQTIGLDLAAGDWVAPFGTGVVTDILVKGDKDVQDNRNWRFSCMLQFTNGNGVVRHHHPYDSSLALHSMLTPPQSFPNVIPTNRYVFWKDYHAGQGHSESDGKDDHLLFQVRTTTNAEGKVISANVGWINGTIETEGRDTKTMWIRFNYYFNPDPHSRSLEPEEIASRQAAR